MHDSASKAATASGLRNLRQEGGNRNYGLGRHEMAGALDLGMVCAVALAGVAIALSVGRYMPVQLLGTSIVAALLMIFTRWGVRRTFISRRQQSHWRVILFGLCLVQAGVWAMFLVSDAEIHVLESALGVVGVIVALMPLLYWFFGLLLAVTLGLLWSLLVVPSPAQLWLGVGLVLVMIFGVLFRRLLGERYRSEVREWECRKEMEGAKSESLDMGERLRYEQERLASCNRDLAEVRELADAAGRAKTEFLATISHEIRTPLNGILPTLEMLQETQLDADQQRYVRAATSSSRHLLRIINDLLDFARAESGKLQLESIELNLEELAASVLDLMRGSAERKGLSLQMKSDGKLPRIVRGDPIRLRQVFANLLSNAIKFTEQGRVELSTELIHPGRREVVIRFNVTDTGVGLSREEAKNLFNSFTQADASTTRKHGGTGLGLAICRRLVELMGGKIGVRSVPGQGSTFWFELPMRRSAHDMPAERTSLEGIRIMSAIINGELASQVSGCLSQWGINEQRVSPVEVIQRLHDTAVLGKSWAFECLLLDSLGSDQQVIPILREIRADLLLKALNVIVVTRSEELAERLQDEFSVYVIGGSFKAESLRRTLNRLFDVAGSSSTGSREEEFPGYLDLNVDQESVLVADTPDDNEYEALGPRVLLAEDNPVNRGVVQRVLRRMGVDCQVAENGQQALDLLMQDEHFDMVLMDCQMPVMDGYAATRAWREHEQQLGLHLPIVAMTANAMPGDREKCHQAGMDDYLAKPVSIGEIETMLGKWVGEGDGVSHPPPPPRTLVEPEQGERRMLDRAILAELQEVMEEGFDRLVRTFLDHSPELMDQLQQAATSRDVAALVAPAHSLKSGSANMGAMTLSSLARDIETAARQGDLETALTAYRKLPTVFLATCASLRSEMKTD